LSPDDAVAMLGQDEPAEQQVKKKVKKQRVNIFQLVSLIYRVNFRLEQQMHVF
jgi:hypothetical protein